VRAKVLVAAATVGGDDVGCGTAADERNGHKKTVSNSETVAGQHSEKITEMPKAKSG